MTHSLPGKIMNIVIFGANSAIASAVARRYAQQGHSLYLIGRDQEKIQRLQRDLLARGAADVQYHLLDVNDIIEHETLLRKLDSVKSPIDIFLMAHGTLPDQSVCEADVASTLEAIQTNHVASIALLTLIANKFQLQGQGNIAVISSVAGDRGRQSNYVYGAAKGGLNIFVQGLAQRLSKHNVMVTLLKPGFVDTPMTVDFDKGMLWVSPDAAASAIIRAINKKKACAYIPWFWWFIMLIIKHIPEAVFRRIRL